MTRPRQDAADPVDWSVTMPRIADDWFFADLGAVELPERFIVPLENPDLYDIEVWDRHLDIERRTRCLTLGSYHGQPLGVMSPKLGAPAAALAVDLLVRRGAREIIGLGFCGGIDESLRGGDVFLPLAAVSSDGTSRAYAPERYPAVADPALLSRLTPGGTAERVALVWSVDAVLTQDSTFVGRCRALGVGAVDMETAALLTVARLRGARAATVLVVSDHPGRGECADPDRLSAGAEAAIGIVLRAVEGA